MTEYDINSVNFNFFRPNNFDSPEDYIVKSKRLANTIQLANKDSFFSILKIKVDKFEEFIIKIESKYKI